MARSETDGGQGVAQVGARVEHGGIRIGTVVDVILDPSLRAVIGYEVRSPDGATRFVPRVACGLVLPACLEVAVPAAMLGDEALPYYRERGVSLAAFPVRQIDARDERSAPPADGAGARL